MLKKQVTLAKLNRLHKTLEALTADLDAIERRSMFLLRRSGATAGGGSIEGFVDHFAIIVENCKSRPKP
jgi:hypothetical protein